MRRPPSDALKIGSCRPLLAAALCLAQLPASAKEGEAAARPAAPRDEGDTPDLAKSGVEASTPLPDSELDEAAVPPSPLEVDYAQYGVALAGEFPMHTGGICPEGAGDAPCIIGLGGGPVIRGGYRPAGPWYVGGAYQFAKLDSNNLYRLGIQQQLRAEGRYYFDTGTRFEPYVTWALGGMIYGNEFGAETGGVTSLAGAGLEIELTRFAVIGLNIVYEPMLFVGFTDTAGTERATGVAHYMHAELVIELRSELGRE